MLLYAYVVNWLDESSAHKYRIWLPPILDLPVGRAVRTLVGARVGSGVGGAVAGGSFRQKVAVLSRMAPRACFRLCSGGCGVRRRNQRMCTRRGVGIGMYTCERTFSWAALAWPGASARARSAGTTTSARNADAGCRGGRRMFTGLGGRAAAVHLCWFVEGCINQGVSAGGRDDRRIGRLISTGPGPPSLAGMS